MYVLFMYVLFMYEVDVSHLKQNTGSTTPSITQKINILVAGNDISPNPADRRYSTASTSDYISSLESASDERVNENRTITVRYGDTLWRIAVRAYGSGFEYPRVFAANPHLTNPNLITTGEIFRVPF